MRIDTLSEYSAAQAVTADAASTNHVDHYVPSMVRAGWPTTPPADNPQGPRFSARGTIFVYVAAAFAAAGTNIQAVLKASADTTIAAADTTVVAGPVLVTSAGLAAGTILLVASGVDINARYSGIWYEVTGTLSGGTVNAFWALDSGVQMGQPVY